jgi:tRNA pseudouridine55 synthase
MNLSGVININKPRGLTSHDVVLKIRKRFPGLKVGHGGTLDPQATGVLPVFIGEATRLTAHVTNLDKEYEGEMVLGEDTDTQDGDGKIVEKRDLKGITPGKIKEIFKQFEGEIEQVPPMYSAVRINGRRLYKLARSGKTVDRTPRKIKIFWLNILEINLPRVAFALACSKGTYIRTLCSDIGKVLGCGAYLSRLSRIRTGDYHISRSIELDEFLKSGNPAEYVK